MLSAVDATPGIPAAKSLHEHRGSQPMTGNHLGLTGSLQCFSPGITHYHPVTHRARAGKNSTHLYPV